MERTGCSITNLWLEDGEIGLAAAAASTKLLEAAFAVSQASHVKEVKAHADLVETKAKLRHTLGEVEEQSVRAREGVAACEEKLRTLGLPPQAAASPDTGSHLDIKGTETPAQPSGAGLPPRSSDAGGDDPVFPDRGGWEDEPTAARATFASGSGEEEGGQPLSKPPSQTVLPASPGSNKPSFLERRAAARRERTMRMLAEGGEGGSASSFTSPARGTQASGERGGQDRGGAAKRKRGALSDDEEEANL